MPRQKTHIDESSRKIEIHHHPHDHPDHTTTEENTTAANKTNSCVALVVIVVNLINNNNNGAMELPQIIFPKLIPGVCHPNVNSSLSLIHDLEDEIISSPSTTPSPDDANNGRATTRNHKTELKSIQPKSKALTRIKEIGLRCEPFLHKSNLYRIQLQDLLSDVAKLDDSSSNSYMKRKTAELSALTKVFDMNYKYCFASESCPTRMNVLNRCLQIHKPELVQSLFQIGRHDLVGGKEKRAVERCLSRRVMNASRDTCNDNF